jgi:hypothetical protein
MSDFLGVAFLGAFCQACGQPFTCNPQHPPITGTVSMYGGPSMLCKGCLHSTNVSRKAQNLPPIEVHELAYRAQQIRSGEIPGLGDE